MGRVASTHEDNVEDNINILLTKDPAKRKIRLGKQKYKVTVDGVDHQIYDTDVVEFDGQQLTGKELYEKLNPNC